MLVQVCSDNVISYIDMLLLQAGMTALHHACLNGQTEIVKVLLMNNADVSATDKVSDKFWIIIVST